MGASQNEQATSPPRTRPERAEGDCLRLSRLDSERFGIPVARLATPLTHELSACVAAADRQSVQLIIARVAVTDWQLIHDLERMGAQLMDVTVEYSLRLPARQFEQRTEPASIRVATSADIEAICQVALESFEDYIGHYHADPRLSNEAATEAYVSWASRSITDRTAADTCWVAELDGRIVGFSTAKKDSEIVVGVLDAVSPRAQRRGIYLALNERRIAWAAQQQAKEVRVTTHTANIPAQRGLGKLGFLVNSSGCTFHLWRE